MGSDDSGSSFPIPPPNDDNDDATRVCICSKKHVITYFQCYCNCTHNILRGGYGPFSLLVLVVFFSFSRIRVEIVPASPLCTYTTSSSPTY